MAVWMPPKRYAVVTVYENGEKVSEHEVETQEWSTRTVRVAITSAEGPLVQDISTTVLRGPVRQVNMTEYENADPE